MSMDISVSLTDNVVKRLAEITRRTDHSLAAIIESAVELYLADYEDCEVALERLHDDDDPTISGADMRATLGL